jgi:integration host factor subunit beta
MAMARPKIKTLTKQDVTQRVCENTCEYFHHAEPWVRSVIQVLGDMMTEADPEVRIELRGFGVFEVKKVRANPRARNPRTNESLYIPSRRKATFRPGKHLKEILLEPLPEVGTTPEGGHTPPRQGGVTAEDADRTVPPPSTAG